MQKRTAAPGRRPWGLTAALLALGALGCREPVEPDPEPETPEAAGEAALVPLALGNVWTYDTRPFAGVAYAETVLTTITDRFTANVGGDRREVYVQRLRVRGFEPVPGELVTFHGNESAGHYFYGGAVDGDTVLHRSPWFLHGEAGATWQEERLVYNGDSGWHVRDTLTRTLHDPAVPCDTPVGARQCLEIRFYLPPLADDVATGDWHLLHLAPGVGLVLHDIYFDEAYTEPKSTARLIDVLLGGQDD